jgi:uncharacterized membrane protein HdeD (DUF308 family)
VFGMMDFLTCLIASLAGAIPSLLFWRRIVEPSTKLRQFIVVMVVFVLGTLSFARYFGAMAGFAFLGAWLFVHGVMRLVTGYRDPPNTSTWGA